MDVRFTEYKEDDGSITHLIWGGHSICPPAVGDITQLPNRRWCVAITHDEFQLDLHSVQEKIFATPEYAMEAVTKAAAPIVREDPAHKERWRFTFEFGPVDGEPNFGRLTNSDGDEIGVGEAAEALELLRGFVKNGLGDRDTLEERLDAQIGPLASGAFVVATPPSETCNE